MPDINIFKDPIPVQGGTLPAVPQQQVTAAPNVLSLPLGDTPLWMNTNKEQTPYRTRLDTTLRYSDPAIGFNPFDQDLEYKYANAHPYKTFGNNIIKGLADVGGAFAETFATIPLAINATAQGDFSKLYDNDLTNGIQDWKNNLDNLFPTYTNRNQNEHPLASWFDGDFLNNLGGAVHGLGFAAGAILGTVAEGAVITALTGGTGTLPAVGVNIARWFGKFGRTIAAGTETAQELANIARTASEIAPDITQGSRQLLLGQGERVFAMPNTPDVMLANEGGLLRLGATNTERGLATLENPNTERGIIPIDKSVAGTGLETIPGEAQNATNPNFVRHTGTGIDNEFAANTGATKDATVNTIDKSLNTLYKAAKIGDAVKYNLSLLTSAMSMGVFEANSTMRNTEAIGRQDFYDKHGYDAQDEDLKSIKDTAKSSANFVMGTDIALLYMANRINWSSILKPTTATIQSAEMKGISGSLISGYKKLATKLDTETGLYKVMEQTPESKLGKLLLRVQGSAGSLKQPLVFTAQNIGMGLTSSTAEDYAQRKFDGKNRGELADYITSFSDGLHKTLDTKEGFTNIVNGFVGGVLMGFLEHGTQKVLGVKVQKTRERLQAQADGLNQATFKGMFAHNIDGAAAMQSLAADYTQALKTGDVFAAKNIKAEMLHSWVNTAVKTNTYEARMDEIEAAENLKGEEFSKMWGGLDYTEDNRDQAVQYLDTVKQKADDVAKDIKKVDRLFAGNPFKPGTEDHTAHETWKEVLARNLGTSRDYQQRIKQLQADITKVLPGLNVNDAIQLTSKKGISDILTKMSTAMDNLTKQELDTKGGVSPELAKEARDKRNALSKLFGEMQQHVFNNFEAKTFIPTLRKMYNLMSGLGMESNDYLTEQKRIGNGDPINELAPKQELNDDDVVDVFQRLTDTNKLHEANYQSVFAYNSLLKPSGAKRYSEYVKGLINKTNANITINPEGQVETPVDIERQATEDAKLFTAGMPEEDNLTKEQRDAVNDAILKEAAGEELTPEEKDIVDKNPLYAEKVKTTEAKKEAILKEKGGKGKAPKQPDITEKNYTEDESGFRKEISPVELLNKINSHEKVGKDANKNLFKAVFSKVNNFLSSGLTAKLEQSDFKAEQAANGNVKQKYKALPLFDATGKEIGTSGIYKARYERNVEVYHNGQMIGLLKPADSLFLDAEGTRPIYDMTEAEFQNVTGMPRSEYKAYMKEINAYKKAYDGLVSEMAEGKSVDNATVLKYFPEVRVNTGGTTFNKGAEKEKDTLIKDLTHRPTGTALISYKNENGYRKARIVNEQELAANNPSYYNKLKAFISSDQFKAQAQQNEGRYMLAMPINGEYTNNSLIYSRPAEIDETAKKALVTTLGQNVGKELSAEEVKTINDNLHNTYYIANADRTVKGTSIDLQVNEDGSLSLQIKNNEKGTAYNNTLNIPDAKITDYHSVIKTIQDRINDEERLDRNLQKLKITVKDDSIKFQTLNDKDVYSLKDVEGKIKVATSPQVFDNFSVNMYPKGSTKGEAKPTTPKSKAPTPSQREAIIQAVKDLKVAGKVTDIDVTMAQSNPEDFLKFIADQAFGVTTDPQGNRTPDGNGGNETSLRETYGDAIVDGAKKLFPLEEPTQEEAPKPKTAEQIAAAKEAEAKRQSDAKIDNEYIDKKIALHDSFINNLTEPGKKIKDFITKNHNFVGKDIVDVQADIAKQADVTEKDVAEYLQAVRTHNIQREKLNDIAESKKNSTVTGSTSDAVFAKNQAETSIILQDLFNLPKDQADTTAQIYERNRQAWVERKYNEELSYRKSHGDSSKEYKLDLTQKAIDVIEGNIADLKDQMSLTNDGGRQMIIQAKIDAEEAKLKDGGKTLYGADLKDYIDKESHTRFGFGKKTEQELTSTDLTQEMSAKQIREELTKNKIININCD